MVLQVFQEQMVQMALMVLQVFQAQMALTE